MKFLVAHDTGNPGSTARQNVRYYTNSCHEMSASAHLFVDDREIIECIPALTATPEKAWHVLYGVAKDNELYGANANDAAIGVEYCYGGSIKALEAYNRYVWVLAKLCDSFGLDPATSIVGHFFLDPRRKTDPVTGLAHSRRTYEQLLRDVVQEYRACKGAPEEVEAAEEDAGTATVAVRLNVRERPDTRSRIIQVLRPGEVIGYTAMVHHGEPVNNNSVWYRLSNGYYVWSGGVLAKTKQPERV